MEHSGRKTKCVIWRPVGLRCRRCESESLVYELERKNNAVNWEKTERSVSGPLLVSSCKVESNL